MHPYSTERVNYRRGAALSSAVVLICALALVGGCASSPKQSSAPSPKPTQQTSVSETGIDYSSGLVSVRAPAGVAPAGTQLSVSATTAPLPGDWGQFASPAGSAVTIQLGSGLQPKQPITLGFNQVKKSETRFVITESEGGVEILPLQPDNTLVAQTDHLSTFWPVNFDIPKYSEYAITYVRNAIKVGSSRPDCYSNDGLYPAAGATISRVEGDVAWPCITRENGITKLSLDSNSGPAWTVTTSPDWDAGYSTTVSAPSSVASAAWLNLPTTDRNRTALLIPETTVNFSTPDFRDTRVQLEIDPVMSQYRTAALVAGIFLPAKAAKVLDSSECLTDLVEAGTLKDEASGEGMAAVVKCVGAAAGGTIGALLGIISDGAGSLWTQLEGIVQEVTTAGNISFDVSAIPTAGAGSPIAVNDVRGMLGTWSGPIAQIGSRAYSTILSLRHDGRTVIGTVEYPELKCSGYLHDATFRAGVLQIKETINKNGSCVTEVGLELRIDGDKLAYYFGRRTRQAQEGTGLLVRDQ